MELKIGQLVRMDSRKYGHGYRIGDTVRITIIDEDNDSPSYAGVSVSTGKTPVGRWFGDDEVTLLNGKNEDYVHMLREE